MLKYNLFGWLMSNMYFYQISTGKKWKSIKEMNKEFTRGEVRGLVKRGDIVVMLAAECRDKNGEIAPYLKYNCEENLNNE